jgi:hypothetical protein
MPKGIPVGSSKTAMLSPSGRTEAGGMYQLQYNSGLGSSGWNNLGSPIPATGATLSVNETVANGPPRFYRVELLP